MTRIKTWLASIRKTISRAGDAILGFVVLVAAHVWKRRAQLVDLAGGACLVTAAALVAPAAGFAVAGVWLTVQAYGIERKGKT